MNTQTHIANWLKDYAVKAGKEGYVIGVSGGVDSAVTSTLCSMTGLLTIPVLLPINQAQDQHDRGNSHIMWLLRSFNNVRPDEVNLSQIFSWFRLTLPSYVAEDKLAMANSKARLRMTTLYAIAQANNALVAGTGNKIEDFSLGFYTKWGDGAVDVSPIAELTKTEVWQLAKELGINQEIINATPTDGLWENNQSDEMQIGATYQEMEWALEFYQKDKVDPYELTPRQIEVLRLYREFNTKNQHKMLPIPICPRLEAQ